MAKAKRSRGRESTVFESCGGSGCAIPSTGGRYKIQEGVPGFSYTTQAKPCAAAGRSRTGKKTRSTCPVQLIYKNGQPYLRFCLAQKRPGKVIAVSSADEAQRVSAEVCKCWRKNRKQFGKCLPASTPLGGLGRAR